MTSSIDISLIQTATHWHDPAANRSLFDRWLEGVPASSDLVVLPEMFSTGFTMASIEQAESMDGPTVSWLIDAARRTGKTLCGSVVIARHTQSTAKPEYVNRLLWVTPAGEVTSYDKRHRFRMAGEHLHYEAGKDRVIVKHKGVRILLQVCYDLRFPVFARNRDDYDVYLLVANWPAARQHHWNTLLAARAIENQCYVVAVNRVGEDGNGVTYSGGSGIYNFQGEADVVSFETEAVLSGQLDMTAQANYREAFPAWQDADRFHLDSI